MPIRMNRDRRNILYAFADRSVSCPKESLVAQRAYDKAADLVVKAVKKRFPDADMAILDRYDVARLDRCIRGGSPNGGFVAFEFNRDDRRIPLTPHRYCSSRSISFDKATADAIAKVEVSRNKHDDAVSQKKKLYNTLIASARTFDEVLEAWPAASEMRGGIERTATGLTALTPDVIKAIRADNAGAPTEEKEAA